MDSPRHAEVADLEQLRAAVAVVGCGWLVTVGPDGAPLANLLPLRWQGDLVVVRVPRDNPQWPPALSAPTDRTECRSPCTAPPDDSTAPQSTCRRIPGCAPPVPGARPWGAILAQIP